MFVYFITAFHEKKLLRVKIGSSGNPEDRLAKLQTGSALRLSLWGKVRCKSRLHARLVEKAAHRLFRKRRTRGEWFALTNDDLAILRRVVAEAAQREPCEMENLAGERAALGSKRTLN